MLPVVQRGFPFMLKVRRFLSLLRYKMSSLELNLLFHLIQFSTMWNNYNFLSYTTLKHSVPFRKSTWNIHLYSVPRDTHHLMVGIFCLFHFIYVHCSYPFQIIQTQAIDRLMETLKAGDDYKTYRIDCQTKVTSLSKWKAHYTSSRILLLWTLPVFYGPQVQNRNASKMCK